MYRVLAALLVLGAAASFVGAADKPEDKTKKSDLSVGSKMPDLVAQDLEGKTVKLSDLKGKVVVVDVWATWCGPCKAMIPHSRELVKKMRDKPFVLVSISIDAKKDTLKDFMKTNEMPWTHWWNGQTGGVVATLRISFIPTIYVVDRKGIIRYKNVRDKELDKAVETLMKEFEDSKKTT
jgi:thiol-disulfide isomerase/thioredoxin